MKKEEKGMKEILRHIVWMTILVSWALLSASCRGGEVSYTDEVQPDDDTAILVLRTGLLDQTRASDRVNDAVDNPVESISSVISIIVSFTKFDPGDISTFMECAGAKP